MTAGDVTITVASSIDRIEAAHWDACAGTANPFVSHAFLAALERSQSACTLTGWQPYHLVAQDHQGQVVGCAPLYAKSHSWGEYVFDFAWAEWLHRHGQPYYPKLLCAVPFSPVTGPRLLVAPGQDRDAIAEALCAAMATLPGQARASSLHMTFPATQDAQACHRHGAQLRMGLQFHWPNGGYACFDDFLGALSSRKRKSIRKERASVADTGLHLRALVGDDIQARHWDAFYGFYLDTIDKKGGEAYLTRGFFEELAASPAGKAAVLMVAEDGPRTIAGAFNMMGTDSLFGRNWGASANIPFLHFELCYYQAIDFAIAHGLTRVEAGAQGEHKLDRGYMPSATWSAHWLADPGLAHAVSVFLRQERAMVEETLAVLAEQGPYRMDGA